MLLFHVIHTSYEHGLKISQTIQGVWRIGDNTNLHFSKRNTQHFFASLESPRQNKEEDTTFDGSNFHRQQTIRSPVSGQTKL
jgi:hypothetical protein